MSDALTLLPSTTFQEPGRAATAYDEHMKIAEAIIAHDADAAEAAGRDHIAMAERLRSRMLFGV
jgi:DNA-binding FadR family transcriptional regulator